MGVKLNDPGGDRDFGDPTSLKHSPLECDVLRVGEDGLRTMKSGRDSRFGTRMFKLLGFETGARCRKFVISDVVNEGLVASTFVISSGLLGNAVRVSDVRLSLQFACRSIRSLGDVSSVLSTNPESRLSDDWCLRVSFAGVVVLPSGSVVGELYECRASVSRGDVVMSLSA